jgi:hypothetical protein
MAYLFLNGPEDHRRPPNNRKRQFLTQQQRIEPADSFVVKVFAELQKIWRREGSQRRTLDHMPSSRQERRRWKRLIRYLSTLAPPEGN